MVFTREVKSWKNIRKINKISVFSKHLQNFLKCILKNRIIVLFTIMILAAITTGCIYKEQNIKAKEGYFDLSSWNFEKDGVVKLNGEWEFYWKELKSPSDISSDNPAQYTNVPDKWKKQQVNEKQLDNHGYATYRLVLKLNNQLNFAGLKIPLISTAYRLWINDKYYSSSGVVGSSPETYVPRYCPDVIYFYVDKTETEILLQVSNFLLSNGGIRGSFMLGTANQIKDIRDANMAIELFIFTSLFVLAIYLISRYFLSNKENILLFYTGLLTLFVSFYSLLSGEMYLLQFVKNINYGSIIKFKCSGLYMSIIVACMFLYEIFTRTTDRGVKTRVKKLLLLFGWFFFLAILISPAIFCIQYLKLLQTILVILGFYLIYELLSRIIREKNRSLLLLLICSTVFVIAIINDILCNYFTLRLDFLTPVGLLIFLGAFYFTFHRYELKESFCNIHRTGYKRFDDNKKKIQSSKIFLTEAVVEYSKNLTTNVELNEVLRILLEKLKNFISFDVGFVILKDDNFLKIVSNIESLSLDIHPDVCNVLVKKVIENPLVKELAINKRHVVVGNLDKNPDYNFIFNDHKEGKSILAVPILRKEKALGAVILKSRKENAYYNSDAEIIYGFAAQTVIIIENIKLFDEVKKLAIEDDLTKIFNRRYFFELAEREFKHHKRYSEFKPLAVVMIDIDNFKSINDTYGHMEGDKVLRMVAQKCKESLRETDLIGRYGGEEFVVLLPHTNAEEAAVVVERLRKNIAECCISCENHKEKFINITVSIGVAVMDDEIDSLDELIKKADKALYAAKSEGKNCVVIL